MNMDALATVTLEPKEIVIRLLVAMLLGAVIGTEREYTHRPAGMRTHMLVALGACAVMITGQMIFCQYYPLGATPDPARLAAQVIAGVGFLGAGTILRDGLSIKGLTTAASVWTVACLGIAAGAGLYIITVVGVVLMMVTLVVFERVQAKLLRHRDLSCTFSVTARSVTRVMGHINELARTAEAELSFEGMEAEAEGMELKFRIKFTGRHNQGRVHEFFAALGESEDVISVRTDKGGI